MRTHFFKLIRQSLFGSLKPTQVDGLNFILNAFDQHDLQLSWRAYMLATVYHECAASMMPIEEYGRGKGRRYGQKIDVDGSRYVGLNHLYYGRGYVQLTWLANYVKARNRLGLDFVNHPELALVPCHAADIMILGMAEGWFTGQALSDHQGYVGMRRIINGQDKAHLIAGYALKFEAALRGE